MINSVVVQGNLTRDPELREVGDTYVCDLGIAVNRRVKKDGEWQDKACFFDATVWGEQAENCAKYLGKGARVTVQGELDQDRWENDSGEKRQKVKILVRAIAFPPKGSPSEPAGEELSGGGDLPF